MLFSEHFLVALAPLVSLGHGKVAVLQGNVAGQWNVLLLVVKLFALHTIVKKIHFKYKILRVINWD